MPLFEPVAAAGQEGGAGGGVRDPQAPGCEEVVHGEQPVQEGVDRVGGRRWAVVVLGVVLGVDVVAVGDAHDRRTDFGRAERAAEGQEVVRLELGDRPEVEVVGGVDFENGLQNDHLASVPQPHAR
ncbi:hypothetical protein ACFQ2B_01110 [Streptomyces stramineus]